MAQNYKTGLIITGDASGGIRAIKATDDELGKLNQGFDRGSRRSKQFSQDVNETSRGLDVLKTSAASVAAAMATAFGAGSIINQARIIADTDSLAQSIGMATSNLQAWDYAAKQAGLAGGQMGDILKDITERIGEFTAEGTGEAAALFENLNLNIEEMKRLAPDQQLLRIADAISTLETRGEQISYLERLGSDATLLLPLLENNAAQLREFTNEAQALGVAMSQVDIDNAIEANRAMSQLTGTMEGFTNQIVADLGPGLASAVGGLSDLIQEAGGADGILDDVKDAATVLAVILAGRLTGSIAATTVGMLESTRQAVLYQGALARMAGVSGTAAASQMALAGATRAGAGALALIGGPAGAAVIAGLGLYYFREELGLTDEKMQGTIDTVGDLGESFVNEFGNIGTELVNGFRGMRGELIDLDASFIDLKATAVESFAGIVSSSADVINLGLIPIQHALNALDQGFANWINRAANAFESAGDMPFGMANLFGEQVSRMRSMADDLTEGMIDPIGISTAALETNVQAWREQADAMRGTADAVRNGTTPAAEETVAVFKTLDEWLLKTTESTDDNTGSNTAGAAAAREAAKETTSLANSYENLLDRIQPNRRAARQYAQDVGVLNLALATGRMTTVQYMQAMGMLQESFQAAQRETESTANAAEDASQRIANSFLSWETVADNTLRRIDDSGQGLWLGLIDGSESALDTVKRGFQQTLAEIAHMLTTQKLTFQVAGMMGLDTTGMPGGGGGGFNLNGISSLYNGAKKLPYVGDAISGIGSALGFGASAAAPIGYASGFGAAAATGTYTGFAGSAAAGAAAAGGGGLMGAASAAMPWVGGALLVDNVLGLGITEGITDAISGLFGGGKTNPHLNIDTRANDSYGHGSVREGAFGAVGFAQGTRRSNDLFGGIPEEREFLAAIAASDDLLASLARSPEELQAMAEAVQGVRLSASNVEGVMSQLSRRTVAAVSAMDGEFGEFVASLGTDVDTIIARTQSAVAALDLLSGASDRLNLQFDASAAGALRAADSIAQMAGGVDQLASLQDSYYTAFFSDAERAADLQQDVAASLREMGLSLPATHEGFRQLVEQQNRLTESGQRNYVQLLQLAGPFDQLQTLLEQTGNGVDVFADRLSQLNGEISTLENEVRNAYAGFEKQSFDQQLQLLGLLGDEQAALALQRERELQGIDPLLQETQRRIWAMEDEAAAQQDATRAGQDYARSLAQVNDQLSSTFNGISQWVDQQSATGGTPGGNLAEARTQLERQLELARSGDRAAMQSITQYADRVLQANEAYNASGPAGQALRDEVLAALEELPGQVTAEEYLAQEIRDALQSVVISAMPTDERLAVELSRELTRLDANQLTAAQVRSALAPHATDAEISRLIREVDANGDGIITKQELANQRLAGLASGIGSTLKPMFDSIDLDASGLIDWNEFYGAFQGLASDAELRRIFRQLDEDGSGTISRLEALNRSSQGTEGNTQNLEERARDQLQELGGLVSEMTRTTDQFVGLNSGISSLTGMIEALGVAEAERARIEKEQAAAEKAERERLAKERQASALVNEASGIQSKIDEFRTLAEQTGQNANGNVDRYRGYNWIDGDQSGFLDRIQDWTYSSQMAAWTARRLELADGREGQLDRLRADYQSLMGKAAPFADGGIFELGRVAANSIVSTPTLFNMGLMGEADPEAIVPLSRGEGGRLGIDASGLMRLPDGPLELPSRELPMPALPNFPLLNRNDQQDLVRDLLNENKTLRKELTALLKRIERHGAAGVAVQQEAAKQQISELKKSNLALDDMSAAARLEASR